MSDPHHRPRPHDHLVEPFYQGLLHHDGDGDGPGTRRLRPGPGVVLVLLALVAALWWLSR